MKKSLRAILARGVLSMPGGSRLLDRLVRLRTRLIRRRFSRDHDVFTYYYRRNIWGSDESFSGPGSTVKYTENIRKEIPRIIKEYGIRKILDAPCGDYNWFRSVPRSQETEYLGGDIVSELIKRNQRTFSNLNTRFAQIDIIHDPLPPADLWLCRDCLVHFSNADVERAISSLLSSDIQYFLTTTYTEQTGNTDIATGDVRFINMEAPPFDLCKPILYIDDWIPGYPVRKLGLWTRSMVASSLADRTRRVAGRARAR